MTKIIIEEAKCPKCKVTTDYRIPRSSIVKLLFPFLKKRFWCPNCGNRFYTTN